MLLSIEWNLIRLGSPAHGIMTKTKHKTLPGVVEVGDVGVIRVGGEGGTGVGRGSDIRTKVKSLKIYVAEITKIVKV